MKQPPLPGEALGLVEISSIARGYVTVDALVKRAESRVIIGAAVTPGKFVLAFDGPVAEVEESMDAALEAAGDFLLDRVFLPGPHDQVIPGLFGNYPETSVDAIGIVEYSTVASAITGLDKALKDGEVDLLVMRLASGIDGKGYFAITGELYFVEASVEHAINVVERSRVINHEIIARPHPDFIQYLLRERSEQLVIKVL